MVVMVTVVVLGGKVAVDERPIGAPHHGDTGQPMSLLSLRPLRQGLRGAWVVGRALVLCRGVVRRRVLVVQDAHLLHVAVLDRAPLACPTPTSLRAHGRDV